MPTNKLLEDKLNNWAKNWRRQQEEMSRQSQYQTQNHTPYNTSAPNWQQTPYQPQAQSFAAQPAAPQQPQQVSAQTSVVSPEIANAAFQKGFASKQKSDFPLKNAVTQAMPNIGKVLYKTGENIGKAAAVYNAVNDYPFQKDDVTYNRVNMGFTNFSDLYNEYKQIEKLRNYYTPLPYNDKYKHAMINCQMAQRGSSGAFTADIGSRYKEAKDLWYGTNTLSESYADMQANLHGRKLGYNNPNEDCDQMVQQYYPKYYPKK